MIYEKCILIPQNNHYLVSTSGIVRNLEYEEIFQYTHTKHATEKYVVLDGIEYQVGRLEASSWIGYEPTFDIIKELTTGFWTYLISTIEKVDEAFIINGTEFKHIPSFREFYISRSGTIFSAKRNKFIRRSVTENNYLVATITDESGYRAPRKIHRLVYSTYVQYPIPKDLVVDHKDGNKHNPLLENLDLISQSENISLNRLHSEEHLFWNLNKNFSNEVLYLVEKLLISKTEIGEIFLMTKEICPLISFDQLKSVILKLSAKKNIPLDYFGKSLNDIKRPGFSIYNYSPAKLTREDIINIRNSDLSIGQLGKIYNMTPQQMWKIKTKKSWKNLD